LRLRFTIRDLLLVTAIIALAVGWWLDHRHQSQRYATLEESASVVEMREFRARHKTAIKTLQAQLEVSKMETERAKAFLPSLSH
jgi:hypothetical protein